MDIRGWETIHYFRHHCHSQFSYSANNPSASDDDDHDDDDDDDDHDEDNDNEDDDDNVDDDYHNANNKSFLILVVEKLDSRAAPGASSPSKPQGLPARVTIIIILIKASIISDD